MCNEDRRAHQQRRPGARSAGKRGVCASLRRSERGDHAAMATLTLKGHRRTGKTMADAVALEQAGTDPQKLAGDGDTGEAGAGASEDAGPAGQSLSWAELINHITARNNRRHHVSTVWCLEPRSESFETLYGSVRVAKGEQRYQLTDGTIYSI